MSRAGDQPPAAAAAEGSRQGQGLATTPMAGSAPSEADGQSAPEPHAQERSAAGGGEPVSALHATPPKIAPEGLILRASPRRIVRFRRGVVIGGTAAGALAIAGVTWIALGEKATRLADASGAQLVNDRRTTADAVADLPGDYGAVAKGTPVLGPPLPGDLGRPILARQRELANSENAASGTRPTPNAAEQAAEAERQRLASQAHQAREAGVLIQTAGQGGAASQPNSFEPALAAPSPNEAPRMALDPERDQNNQQRKIDFLEKERSDVAGTTSMHRLEGPASSFQVMAGSVISASLITGIKSDLPGTVVAQVTENVFDTVTGQILLIPQGSRLIGRYDSVVAFGQKRALLAWLRIILPDGSSIQLDNVPASDAAGYSGLADGVNFHTWQLLKGVALSTLLSVGTELSLGNDEGELLRAIRQSTQQSASQAGQQMVAKNLNVQPTITIRPGWPLRVIVHKDIVLRPWAGAR